MDKDCDNKLPHKKYTEITFFIVIIRGDKWDPVGVDIIIIMLPIAGLMMTLINI